MRTHIKYVCLAGVLLLVTGSQMLSFAQQPPTATIQRLSGTVFTTGMQPAQVGDTLFMGDAILTEPGSHAQIILSDGSSIEIGEGVRLGLTELLYTPSSGARRTTLYLLQGQIRVNLSQVYQHSGSAFRLETQNARIDVSSQADIEIQCQPQADMTTASSQTAALQLTHLSTGETLLLPAGHTGIVQGMSLRDMNSSLSRTDSSAHSQSWQNTQIQPATSSSSLLTEPEYDGEYSLVPMATGVQSPSQYFDSLQIPSVYKTSECSKNTNKCWPVIKNHQSKKLHSFSRDDKVSVLATGRYRNRAAILVRRSWKSGKDYRSEMLLMDDKGKRTTLPDQVGRYVRGVFDSLLTPDDHLVLLTSEGLTTVDSSGNVLNTLAAPQKLSQGVLQNNPDGEIAAIAVGATNHILLSNRSSWVSTDIMLTEHGDREEILGVYPESGRTVYGAVYKYVSAYNKGVYLLEANFSNQTSKMYVVFNSEKRNVGFSPQVYSEKEYVVVSANNASLGKPVFFRIPKNTLTNSEYLNSRSLIDVVNEQEKDVDFLVGTGIGPLFWIANSKVEDSDNDITYGEAEYEISNAMLLLAQFEARFKKTRLALSYLRNWATDYAAEQAGDYGGDLTKKASKFLLGSLSFDGLISPSSTIRLTGERAELNGVSTFTARDSAKEIQEFETTYYRIAGLYIMEKGAYLGADYMNYSMPSAIGFSDDSKDVVYTTFDDDLGIQKVGLFAGYDSTEYVKRYETNIKTPYINTNIGLSLGKLSLSDDVEQTAKYSTGTEKITTPGFLALDGTLEVGYLIQRRSKSVKGLGMMFSLGYRAKGTLMRKGQSEKSDRSLDPDELAVEFSRWDVLHGPVIMGNIIF